MTKHWDCKLMFKEEQDAPEMHPLLFLHKEHRMVRYVQSTKTDIARHQGGGGKPQQNINRSSVAMVNKAEHRYQVKASVSGRAIVATQL
jgi:hypothetical protein